MIMEPVYSYKLENQNSCLNNSVQIWTPRNQRAIGVSHSPSLKAWEPEVLISFNSPFIIFNIFSLVYSQFGYYLDSFLYHLHAAVKPI